MLKLPINHAIEGIKESIVELRILLKPGRARVNLKEMRHRLDRTQVSLPWLLANAVARGEGPMK
jgi:hypothetical protein